jgi:twinkle protein
MDEVFDYLNLKGWGFKLKNEEYELDDCPFNGCGPGHFYINQKTHLFYCHKCGKRGHLLSLKKRLGDLPQISHVSSLIKTKTPSKIIETRVIEEYHRALLENKQALSYLMDERCFSLETIRKFKLGFYNGSIAIPYFKDGHCLNIKFRLLGEKKYFRREGHPSILFNLDNARKYQNSLVITEGEFDAMTFDQMGFPNVVSVPNGAESFSGEWIDDLESFESIYISFDMDEAGRRGAEKVADRLGRYRCYDVLLPLEDANECLKAGFTTHEISEFLAKAKPFQLPLVRNISDFFDEVRAFHFGRLKSEGIRTGFAKFDGLLGGLRFTELTVLTGETGSGKTTWTANLGFRLAKIGHPVLIASFEMKPIKIIRKMIQMESGKLFYDLTEKELENNLIFISTLPIHFIDSYGEIDLLKLKDGIFYATRRFGIQVVILDHLHFFLKFSADNERHAIDQSLRDFKSWAMGLNIHILLVVHPTKIETENRPIRLNDLKGSSGLKQIPDNVLSIWRPIGKDFQNREDNEVVLYILKCRDDFGKEGKLILRFDEKSQRYEDSGPGIAIPAEGRVGPERSSPRSRGPSGRDYASGCDA